MPANDRETIDLDDDVKRKNVIVLVSLVAVLVVLAAASCFIGRYPISPVTMIRVVASKIFPIDPDWPSTVETVVFNIRLPRVAMALLVGAGLSISGAAFQGMFQNPLVSPDILGVTTGAGFGAAVAILLSGSIVAIQVSALCFGILAVGLTYAISRVYRTTPTLMLVLGGIVVGAIFSALISLTKYVADPQERLPAITFWLMGSLANISKRDLVSVCIPMVIGTVGLLLVRWRINLLSLGDEEARALGVRTELLKGIIIVCATAVTASAVSVSGIIGWVGLVIPHIGRMLVGPDHKILLPVSMLIGAGYLLAIDNIARAVTAVEIPLGILTAIIGAPFFAFLLRRTQGGRK